jgi:two-component system response regulator MprA
LLRRTEADASGLLSTRTSVSTRPRDVTCGDRALDLTRTEFALLELLMRNPRAVIPGA